MNILSGLLAMGILMFLLMMVIPILLTIFWVLMLIDCAKRKFKSDSDKIVWILVILLANVIGASIYYFAIKSKE